jgi:hypothetical protein
MVELQLAPESAARLAEFLRWRQPHAAITAHWQHFADLNRIEIGGDGTRIAVHAGPGFDSDYELNFRGRSAREFAVLAANTLRGRNDDIRFDRALQRLWGRNAAALRQQAARVLGQPLTAHKTLAAHYAGRLLPHLSQRPEHCYLEIGPGTGYLAALMRAARPGPLVLVDIPEILPFSFLYLHRLFPAAAYRLPHEIAETGLRIASDGMYFLTPAQLALVPPQCADLAVNTASFGEMLPQQIAAYFDFLRVALKRDGLFFTANRVEKWMAEPGADREIPVRFEDYPWRPADRDVFCALSDFHEIVQPESPIFTRLCHLAAQ